VTSPTTRPSPCNEDGSSLPELMLAAGLVVVALGMLGSTVVAPLSMMLRSAAPDVRQAELEVAADSVVRIVSLARPGLDRPAVLRAESDRLELRLGDLRQGQGVALVLRGDTLEVELLDESSVGSSGVALYPQVPSPVALPMAGALVVGLDADLSSFTVRSAEGDDLTGSEHDGDSDGPDGTTGQDDAPSASSGPWVPDAAVVEVVLQDPPSSDGQAGRTASRTVHLRIRSPLAVQELR